MPDNQIMSIQVGKPAPFKVPDREGCMLEIGYPANGLNVLVQYPNLNKAELKAFQSPLVGYSYYESETIVPIAYWIFQFPNKLFIETTFNACFALNNPPYLTAIESYMEDVKNGITFYFLDRNIVKGIRVIGIHTEAVLLFHKTINAQLEINFTPEDFMLTLKQMEAAVSTEELFHMGKVFSF
jgi:hypothetical protein